MVWIFSILTFLLPIFNNSYALLIQELPYEVKNYEKIDSIKDISNLIDLFSKNPTLSSYQSEQFDLIQRHLNLEPLKNIYSFLNKTVEPADFFNFLKKEMGEDSLSFFLGVLSVKKAILEIKEKKIDEAQTSLTSAETYLKKVTNLSFFSLAERFLEQIKIYKQSTKIDDLSSITAVKTDLEKKNTCYGARASDFDDYPESDKIKPLLQNCIAGKEFSPALESYLVQQESHLNKKQFQKLFDILLTKLRLTGRVEDLINLQRNFLSNFITMDGTTLTLKDKKILEIDEEQKTSLLNSLLKLGSTLWNNERIKDAEETFHFIEKLDALLNVPQTEASFKSLLSFAKMEAQKQNYRGAIPALLQATSLSIFNKLGKKVKEDAYFFLLFYAYQATEYETALSAANLIEKNIIDHSFDLSLRFWKAKIYEKMGKKKESKYYYSQVFQLYPISFYGFLSAKKLNLSFHFFHPQKIMKEAMLSLPFPNPTQLSNLIETNIPIKRIFTLISLGLLDLAKDEIRTYYPPSTLVQELGFDVTEWKAYLFGLQADFLSSSQNLFDWQEEKKRSPQKEFYNLMFPSPYQNLVHQFAKKNKLDPYLLYALMMQESRFDSFAVSRTRAIGLMQVLPEGAKQEFSDVKTEDLFKPEVNIRVGSAFLKRLLKKYSQNYVYAIAAYNAGEEAVDRWKTKFATSDLEEFIELIPYAETKHYVKVVLRNYIGYLILYKKIASFPDFVLYRKNLSKK